MFQRIRMQLLVPIVQIWCFSLLAILLNKTIEVLGNLEDIGSCSMKTSVRARAVMQENHGITFCADCEYPQEHGSYAATWEAKYRPRGFRVSGDIIYGVPNDGSDDFFNEHHLKGNIALVDRGGDVSFFEKVSRAQKAGAIGVIIVDNGECSVDFQCQVLGSKATNEFLEQDDWFRWEKIAIPTVLVTSDDGSRIKQVLGLVTMELEGLGQQYMIAEE